jgi:hypothetical protein
VLQSLAIRLEISEDEKDKLLVSNNEGMKLLVLKMEELSKELSKILDSSNTNSAL